MITNCPICDTKLVKKEGQVDYFCPNLKCPARHIEGLIHFVSRDAMNIDGLGERIMEDFYNFNYIKKPSDIYNLKQHEKELKRLEGYGDKSVNNLLDAIEKSKDNSLEKLIFGLGIPNVGAKTAKILAKNYKTLDNLMKATEEDLTSIKDIGAIIAKCVAKFFNQEDQLEEINKLKEIGLNTKYLGQDIKENENFSNKTFVLTGTLEIYTRDEAKQIIEENGGTTSSSVSSKTSAVIVGKNPGSKYEKAKKLGIDIWTEEMFKEKIG